MVGRAGTLHAELHFRNAPFVEPARIRQLGPYNGGIQPPCFCIPNLVLVPNILSWNPNKGFLQTTVAFETFGCHAGLGEGARRVL